MPEDSQPETDAEADIEVTAADIAEAKARHDRLKEPVEMAIRRMFTEHCRDDQDAMTFSSLLLSAGVGIACTVGNEEVAGHMLAMLYGQLNEMIGDNAVPDDATIN